MEVHVVGGWEVWWLAMLERKRVVLEGVRVFVLVGFSLNIQPISVSSFTWKLLLLSGHVFTENRMGVKNTVLAGSE